MPARRNLRARACARAHNPHHNPHHNQQNKEDLPQAALTLVKLSKEAKLGIPPTAPGLTSSATGVVPDSATSQPPSSNAGDGVSAAKAISVDEAEKTKQQIMQYSKNALQVTYPVHSH